MAFPAWPVSLPALRGMLPSLMSSAVFPAPLKTTFDGGNALTRRRYLGRPPTPIAIELELSPQTLPTFLNFVEDDLNMGTRPFTGPVLMPNGTIAPKTCQIDAGSDGLIQLRWDGPLAPRPSFVLLVWGWRS